MFLLVPAYRPVQDKRPLNGCCCCCFSYVKLFVGFKIYNVENETRIFVCTHKCHSNIRHTSVRNADAIATVMS